LASLHSLRTACDYVHLNPLRAGLLPAHQPLSAYAWSSYPLYVRPARRPAWLRVDGLRGKHGIKEDTAEGLIHFQARMEERRKEGKEPEAWVHFVEAGAWVRRTSFNGSPSGWASADRSTNRRANERRPMNNTKLQASTQYCKVHR